MEPFGFTRKQAEKNMDNPFLSESLFPVEINALMMKDKKIKPLSITWEDQSYRIDRVYDVKEGKSLKEHQNGLIFKCRISNKNFILLFDGERWFIEL